MPRKKQEDSDNPEPNAEPKRPGKDSDFAGSRLEFLRARLPTFLAIGTKSQGKKKRMGEFWRGMEQDYWRKYDWRLALTEEPPTPSEDAGPADADAAFRAMGVEDLSEEEEKQRSTIQTEMSEKLRRWFHRQRAKKTTIRGNPFFSHLKMMRKCDETSAPRLLPDWQYYMQHDDHKKKISDAFEKAGYDKEPSNQHLTLRGALARDFLAKETEEERQRLEDEQAATHAAALEESEETEEGMPSIDPEIQKHCRENFETTILPLLAGLRAYTGFTINVVAAHIDTDGTVTTKSANAGTVHSKDWAQWAPKTYGPMLQQFLRFAHADYLETNGQPAPESESDTVTNGTSTSTSTTPTVNGTSSSTPTVTNGTTTPISNNTTAATAPSTSAKKSRRTSKDSGVVAPPVESLANPNLIQMTPKHDAMDVDDDHDDDEPEGGGMAFAFGPPSTALLNATTTVDKAAAPVVAPEKPKGKLTWGLSEISSPLRNKLLALSKHDRADRLRELRSLPAMQLTRENNLAQNAALRTRLGIGLGSNFMGMKRKNEEGGNGKRKKRRTDDEDWDSDDEDDESEDEGAEENEDVEGQEGESEEEPVRQTKRQSSTRARKPGKQQKQQKSADDPTAWAREMKADLMERGARMGPEWEPLVDLWWKLEESTGFDVGKGKGFTTKNRPDQMRVWIGRGRTGVAPELMVNSFAKNWWKWWKTLNPDWRLPDGQDGELVQEGSGSWKSLTLPGQNGLLGPIACLKWWHERLETEDQRAEWKRAVEDVTWVLRGMNALIEDTVMEDVEPEDAVIQDVEQQPRRAPARPKPKPVWAKANNQPTTPVPDDECAPITNTTETHVPDTQPASISDTQHATTPIPIPNATPTPIPIPNAQPAPITDIAGTQPVPIPVPGMEEPTPVTALRRSTRSLQDKGRSALSLAGLLQANPDPRTPGLPASLWPPREPEEEH